MSSTTTTKDPQEVAEDFNVSSDLPLRLKSSSRQNTVFIAPSVFTSPSSVDDLAQTSVTPCDQEETDATSGSGTIFGISFPCPPPPNTPAESSDGISVSGEPSPKSGWTGEYSDPGTSFTSMSKLGWTGEYSQSDPITSTTSMSRLRWTGEYSTSGVEPEHLMARLGTLANTSEDEPDKTQSGDEEISSGDSSPTKGDESACTARNISPEEEEEVAKLARQAIWGMTPLSAIESLEIKQVTSGAVTITNSVAQPQSAALCNIENDAVPETAEAVVSPPIEAKSTRDAKFVKREEDSHIGRVACCMSLFKMRSKPEPQAPVNQPKHATLSPTKSCLKPSNSLAGIVLDRIEEGSPHEPVPAPKPPKSASITFDLDETAESDKSKRKLKSKSKSYFNFNLFSKSSYEETQDTSDEEEELDPDSPFAAQDVEIQRRLARADVHRDANERAAIIRGALDFLLVVSDRVDSVAADRIGVLLDKTGDRCLGSYTGEEKDHVNPHQYGNKVSQSLYRSKETAMSYKRR
ncbi:hypothetical protein FVEG_03707 [Fusarium verticillioides 7600]|uniref:Uncharacterized protein n=1 Tax=Gibberella moniliformis (strain M3125 / FGSC 7600) TaxID=334819 RepID=W7M296_GIBM7|nr:hypothetical protein FVEG_03707 [Fusarium verticillioides 7600]EWG41634.1 hypothetical protein FVEG_03707 [Fusarium verticillioides 7600]